MSYMFWSCTSFFTCLLYMVEVYFSYVNSNLMKQRNVCWRSWWFKVEINQPGTHTYQTGFSSLGFFGIKNTQVISQDAYWPYPTIPLPLFFSPENLLKITHQNSTAREQQGQTNPDPRKRKSHAHIQETNAQHDLPVIRRQNRQDVRSGSKNKQRGGGRRDFGWYTYLSYYHRMTTPGVYI